MEAKSTELITLMSKCKWREGIKLFKNDKIVLMDWELLWNLGWCCYKVHNVNKANEYFKMAVNLTGNDIKKESASYLGLGLVSVDCEEFATAEQYLIKSYQIKSCYLNRIFLAYVYLKKGEVALAEKLHLENIEKRPKDFRVYKSYSAFLYDINQINELVVSFEDGLTCCS